VKLVTWMWLGAAIAFALSVRPACAVDRSLGASVPRPVASGAPWDAGAQTALAADVDALLKDAPALRGAHVGLLAVDVRDSRSLYARNADEAFIPASTLKLLTGSAALDTLGPTFHFRTEVYIANPIVAGTVQGWLYFRGNGDVLLDDPILAGLGPAVRAAGIRSIVFHSEVPAGEQRLLPGWSWDDLLYDYAAGVESLGFNHNSVRVHVAPGAYPGRPAQLTILPWGDACLYTAKICSPENGFYIWNTATTGAAGTTSTVDIAPDTLTNGGLNVTGSIAAGGAPEDIDVAVPRPTRFFEFAARRSLSAAGIVLGPFDSTFLTRSAAFKPTLPERVIWSHDSEPLTDLLADMWWPSDNLLAEELLRAVGSSALVRVGTSAQGIAREQAWLTTLGMDPALVSLSDGSGLSVYNRLSPRVLTTVLLHDWNGPYHDMVLDDLAIAGVRGTLKTAFKGTDAEGRVFAKTGSMSHVNNLAGYVATQCHGTVAFALLVDDWLGTTADLRDLQARLLTRVIDAPC
jgi:D-alanyl-D-alanine carboxypeptidase/D-alanyl-D-alanine-endopeptidase (penicillin-binding protein 4)